MAAPSYPIFVLTLEGDDERRSPLLSQLETMGLSYELFFGVDGRNGLPPEYESQIDRSATMAKLGRKMSDGEYACALSHRKIYQTIIDNGLAGAVILEDDAVLTDSFATFIWEQDYKKAPMILLDYAYGRAMPFRSRKVSCGKIHRCAVQCTMANAYCLSATVARELINASSPVDDVADWPASLYHLGAWIMVPRLAHHEAPHTRAVSHLDAERNKLVALTRPGANFGAQRFETRLRRRISVRVGRARGER